MDSRVLDKLLKASLTSGAQVVVPLLGRKDSVRGSVSSCVKSSGLVSVRKICLASLLSITILLLSACRDKIELEPDETGEPQQSEVTTDDDQSTDATDNFSDDINSEESTPEEVDSEDPTPAAPAPEVPAPEVPAPEDTVPDDDDGDDEETPTIDYDAALTLAIASSGLNGDPSIDRVLPNIQDPLAQLGKKLFFSKSLSGDFDVACASCHHPLLGGGDDLSLPVGVDALDPDLLGPGRIHDGDLATDSDADGGANVPRNSPSTFNVAFYDRSMFWDGRVYVLDESTEFNGTGQIFDTPETRGALPDQHGGENLTATQALFPVTSANEMRGRESVLSGLTSQDLRNYLAARLRGETSELVSNNWLQAFRTGFDDAVSSASTLMTYGNIAAALAQYQNSQVFVNSPWAEYVKGDVAAISDDAKAGALLFLGDVSDGGFNCIACHSGDFFTDEQFHNIAIPQLGRGKKLDGQDAGRVAVTGTASDSFTFRTPNLLNVEETGPWGHDGAFATLESVVAHHLDNLGANQSFDYTLASLAQFALLENIDDTKNRNNTVLAEQSFSSSADLVLLSKKTYTAEQLASIVSFLKALTDPCVKNAGCLADWLPSLGVDDPDGKLLLATFSTFAEQPDPIVNGSLPGGGGPPTPSGDLVFTDVTTAAGLSYALPVITGNLFNMLSGGVAVADVDEDGFLDIFVSHGKNAASKYFKNNKDGTFSDVSVDMGITTSTGARGALFIDIDFDRKLDLLVSESSPMNIRAYKNAGVGNPFQDITPSSGLATSRSIYSMAAGDYDLDGDLDLFTAHWGFRVERTLVNYLWRQDGTGSFDDVSNIIPIPEQVFSYDPDTAAMWEFSFTPNFSDINGDHYPDLLLAADYENSQYFLNQAGSSFSLATSPVISDENGMGAAIGDYDNDGDLDWFVTSIWDPDAGIPLPEWGVSGNRLYNNDGLGNFSDATTTAGVRFGYWGWGACFADFDNDGDLDLFHVNGMGDNDAADDGVHTQFRDDPSRFFLNNNDGTFQEVSSDVGIVDPSQGRGLSCLDYDDDGDLDILIAVNGRSPILYNNDLDTGKHYLRVRLEGLTGNIQGAGAKIWVETDSKTQMRELRSGSNYLSNNPMIAHFGLDDETSINQITIVWPDAAQTTTVFSEFNDIDKTLVVSHPSLP